MTLSEKLALPYVRLDIGAGYTGKQQPAEEWIYLDGDERVDGLDIIADFGNIPLPDASVDEIAVFDIIEHIPQFRYDEVFKEWNRILKIGGKIKGACPNIHSTMLRYASGDLKLEDALGAIYGSGENIWQVHYNGFTVFTLTDLLFKYGFEFVDFSESPGSYRVMDSWWLKFEGVLNRKLA